MMSHSQTFFYSIIASFLSTLPISANICTFGSDRFCEILFEIWQVSGKQINAMTSYRKAEGEQHYSNETIILLFLVEIYIDIYETLYL